MKSSDYTLNDQSPSLPLRDWLPNVPVSGGWEAWPSLPTTQSRGRFKAARGHFWGPAPTPRARCPRLGRPSSGLLPGKAHAPGALRPRLRLLAALRRPGFGLAYLLYDGELREPGSVPAVENWVDSVPSPHTAVLRQPRGGADGGSSWGRWAPPRAPLSAGPLFRPAPRRARFLPRKRVGAAAWGAGAAGGHVVVPASARPHRLLKKKKLPAFRRKELDLT